MFKQEPYNDLYDKLELNLKYTNINRLQVNYYSLKQCQRSSKVRTRKSFQLEGMNKSQLRMKQRISLSHFKTETVNNVGWIEFAENISTAEDLRDNQNITPAILKVLLAPTLATSLPEVKTIPTDLKYDSIKNVNSTGEDLNSFYFYETEQFAVLWILFAVIVLGNTSVLVAMFLNKNRKSRMNFFIKQLALADLLVGLLHVLTDIIWRITIEWRAGNAACKIIRFSQVCVTYASTYLLVALSIDRYDAITHPMNFSKSWKRARRLVTGAWIISSFLSAPMLYLYEEKVIQGQTQCWIDLGEPWRWQVYMSAVSITLFALPALIITACYAVIVRTIWVKGSLFVPGANAATRRASSRGIIPRAKVKTIKMTFVIVIVFIICWSPYIVFDLLQVFGHIPRTQTNIAIATFIQSLAPLNSAANPLIYCLFSSQIFRTLRRVPPFKWFCWKSRRRTSLKNRCNTVGQRIHNSCDSMRTLTTSLTVSRRSNKAARVVIVERPRTTIVMSSEV
ncbi:cardioacceleratory peptide receptor [Episyrphus balteatus]|uniref:cardioacceleratory peptide receptor n=1 Tax=Episyrphus balteatus TaxID=286459 RepID=UPI002485B20D|nr:cardioacceleratory peptide receptor [Episyrphus balteatus]XP_055849767.1 cardioacceleratory peptide receptor [Episyrphus balteatus]